MALHNELGKNGEDLAVAYLIENGYQILERNWAYDRIEIDIIAENEEFIVFVEVKTRSSSFWGNPEDAISTSKIKRIVTAADYYLKLKDIEKSTRFDVMPIVITKKDIDLKHIEDAFFAPLD